ncbi:MAG: hypothetical protein ABSH03_08190 [Candidatus Lustribacter sp.]
MMRGFWGRFFIAVEPLTIGLVFTVLATGLLLRHQQGAIFVAPIFGGAAILFFAYATVLMSSVTRAVFESHGSIWTVDGYVAYRAHEAPDRDISYSVAVLDENKQILGEWPLDRRPKALDRDEPWPALVEFCRYGGVLRIDGRSTGVLPDDIPALGIGAPAAFARSGEEVVD